MATLWAKTVTFDSIQEGDEFPILVKHESQETINLYAKLAPAGPREGWHNLHTDEKYATEGLFTGTVNMGVATLAYVAELMEKAFPIKNLLAKGSKLEMRATQPVRAGDTVTFTGQITAKRVENGQHFVDCEITGTNQDNQVVVRAKASIFFG